jgi:aryl-alcohol dehydrogenase-like predicted oxidoreductase
MQTRPLGRTGHDSSVVIFGAAAIGKVSQEAADEAISIALDHGVNHIDIAPSYGKAEARLRPWMPKIRDRVFLGCKTTKRQKSDAAQELRASLENLRTDSFDLYQLHSVGDAEHLDLVTAKGGALEALVAAREEGLTRFIGITGHGLDAPATHLEALRRFDFDTVMFPLNPRLWAISEYRSAAEELIHTAAEKNVGTLIIKSVAREPWGDRDHSAHTWYKPFEDQDAIDRSAHFIMSQNITALASPGDVALLPKVLDAAERFVPMSDASQAEAVEACAGLELIFSS